MPTQAPPTMAPWWPEMKHQQAHTAHNEQKDNVEEAPADVVKPHLGVSPEISPRMGGIGEAAQTLTQA